MVHIIVKPGGTMAAYTYDPLGRPTARSTTGASGCSNCAVYAFTYNNAGNELTKVSTISGDAANGTTSHAYDPLSRVTGCTPPAVISTQSYTWNSEPDRASITTGNGTLLPRVVLSSIAKEWRLREMIRHPPGRASRHSLEIGLIERGLLILLPSTVRAT